jgi:acyl-ACP thioesterase
VFGRFFSGIPHPHLLGDRAPDALFWMDHSVNAQTIRHEQRDLAAGDQANKISIWSEQFRIHSYEVALDRLATLESLCRHFQEAAWNHAEHLGVGYERLRQGNRVWVLARLRLKVERRARWGEVVTLQTWPRQAKSAFALRDFEIFDCTGVRVVAGASAWLVLDMITRKPQRVDKLVSEIGPFPEKRALEQESEKLGPIESRDRFVELVARYSDVDVNGHVNNARYVSWIMDSYSMDFHQTHSVRSFEIDYLGETISGESISVLSQEKAPGECHHSIKKTEKGNEVCRARLFWSQI